MPQESQTFSVSILEIENNSKFGCGFIKFALSD